MNNKKVTLTIPAQMNYFGLVRGMAEQIAEMAQFETAAVAKISLALEETIAKTVEYSKEEALIEIIFEFMPTALKIRVHDWGKPWDATVLPEYCKGDTVELGGLGMLLLKGLMDEVTFLNRGRDGNEVSLVKYFGRKIMDMDDWTEAQKPMREIGEIKEIRRMEPREAVAVAGCIYEAYGNSYPNEKMYYPEQIRELNKSGAILSWVVVLTNDEIVGHVAMERSGLDENLYEFGAAAVYPEYRGRGLLNTLGDAILEKSKKLGKCGVYTGSVCSHPYSQKASHRMGLVDCYLLLVMLPNMKFSALRPQGSDRESILHSFRYLQDAAEVKWYLPQRHRPMITRICQQLGVVIQAVVYDPMDANALQAINMEVKANPYGSAEIIVASLSIETARELQRQLKMLCLQHVEVIYCYLPLHTPVAQQLCSAVEEMGFFFGGVVPGSDGKGWLVLQYLNNRRVDYNAIELDSAFGQELVDYIKQCNEAVNE